MTNGHWSILLPLPFGAARDSLRLWRGAVIVRMGNRIGWGGASRDCVREFQGSRSDRRSTVQALIEALDLTQKRVAVEVNGELVTKAEWSACVLRSGDRVEVVSFVGGG